MSEICLIRHTAVGVADGTCYGHLDVPLSSDASAQIHRVLEKFESQPDDVIYSSPSTRCAQLAHAICAEPIIDERLMEFNFGAWEGRLWAALPRAEIDAWAADIEFGRAPGGDNLAAVLARADACLGEARARHTGRIIFVTHGGVIRVLLAHLLGMGTAQALCFHIDYGGISQVRSNNGSIQLMYMNR
jgi:alpha-ribazole phosphatase